MRNPPLNWRFVTKCFLLLFALSSCKSASLRAPSIDVFGSYFPAWAAFIVRRDRVNRFHQRRRQSAEHQAVRLPWAYFVRQSDPDFQYLYLVLLFRDLRHESRFQRKNCF
jgi:hypothetical protein